MKAVLGVDPGLRGAIVLLCADGRLGGVWAFGDLGMVFEMVDTVRAATTALRSAGGTEAYLEKVGYRPTDGGKGAFTFGKVTGVLHGALVAYGADVVEVAPQLWQTSMECLTHGDKNVSKRRAIELFPDAPRITHATADALLIAAYGQARER